MRLTDHQLNKLVVILLIVLAVGGGGFVVYRSLPSSLEKQRLSEAEGWAEFKKEGEERNKPNQQQLIAMQEAAKKREMEAAEEVKVAKDFVSSVPDLQCDFDVQFHYGKTGTGEMDITNLQRVITVFVTSASKRLSYKYHTHPNSHKVIVEPYFSGPRDFKYEWLGDVAQKCLDKKRNN